MTSHGIRGTVTSRLIEFGQAPLTVAGEGDICLSEFFNCIRTFRLHLVYVISPIFFLRFLILVFQKRRLRQRS